jgi:branched-chain amino acid transport system substrate-binding protein
VLLLVACGSRQPYSRLLQVAETPIATSSPGGTGPAPEASAGSAASVGTQAAGSQATGSQAAGQAGGSPAGGSSAGGTYSAGSAGSAGAGSPDATGAAVSAGQPSTGAPASGPTGGDTGGGGGCASSGSTIVIGSVGEQSGIAGAAVADGPKAVAAWAQYVNATQGGVSCHPVKYVIADDGGDPSLNAQLTEQLVEQDHVVAFVQNDAPLAANGGESFLIAHDIPVIGSEGATEYYNEHPNFFPQAASGDDLVEATFAGLAAYLSPQQKLHVGVLSCIEASNCSTDGKDAPSLTKRFGMGLVYNGTASLSAPDFTSECVAAKQAGATVFMVIMDPNSIHRIGASCAGVDYHPLLVTTAQVTTPDEATDPNLDGLLTILTYAPWTATNYPNVALFQKVLSQYGVGTPLDGSSIDGWVAALLFGAGTTDLPTDPSGQSIVAGMDTIKNDDLGGITAPLTFASGADPSVGICWYYVQLRGGSYASPNGSQRECL